MTISKINHTQISNDFLEIHMKNLSGGATKVFLAISRKTIGWHKETDSISISQIMVLTGLSNRGVINSISELEKNGLIKVFRKKTEKDFNYTNKYTIDYEESSQGSEESSQGSEESSPISSEESSQTKETIKETKTKESKKFIVPSLNDILSYISDNSLSVDGAFFLKYYTESNWIDGYGKKVINWKLKLLTWDKQNKTYGQKPAYKKKEIEWQELEKYK